MRTGRRGESASGIGRRRFLKASAACVVGLATASARAENAPRVVIVGAGIAGLGAAHVLQRHRVPFVLVEARDRIGGRAFTDWKTLGMPFDQGCGYLGAPQVNPAAALATELGFSVTHDVSQPDIWLGSVAQGERGLHAFELSYGELTRAIDAAGAHGDDLSAATLIGARTVWDRLAAFAVGPEQTGVGLNQLSTLDWYSQFYNSAPREGRIKQGIGNVVTAFGAGIPVSLSTAVTRIDMRGPRIRVETGTGTLEADYCLLTVPLGVLRAGAISFLPALPQTKQAAIAAFTVGLINKVALSFKPGTLPPEKSVWRYQLRKDDTISDVTVRPFGYDTSVHVSGGDLARELELLNDAEQISLALSTITDIYGNDAASGFVNGAVTRWWRDPRAQGSHSAALPGQAHQRAELGRPVADRLYFAGEACAVNWASSLPGALQSGRAAARAIAEKLGFAPAKDPAQSEVHEKPRTIAVPPASAPPAESTQPVPPKPPQNGNP